MSSALAEAAAGGLDPRLLAMLVCPVTRGRLVWKPAEQLLISEAAGLAFRVVDGVPIMLADEALPWPAADAAPGAMG